MQAFLLQCCVGILQKGQEARMLTSHLLRISCNSLGLLPSDNQIEIPTSVHDDHFSFCFTTTGIGAYNVDDSSSSLRMESSKAASFGQEDQRPLTQQQKEAKNTPAGANYNVTGDLLTGRGSSFVREDMRQCMSSLPTELGLCFFRNQDFMHMLEI